jgi:hypothetical protein
MSWLADKKEKKEEKKLPWADDPRLWTPSIQVPIAMGSSET